MKPNRSVIVGRRAALGAAFVLLLGGALRGQVPDALDADERLGGREIARLLEPVAAPVRASTVRVMRDGQPAALGTILSDDGLIATKASEVQGGELTVILHDNRSFKARQAAVDAANDLALIRIDARGIAPVRWDDREAEPELGQWVVAPWADGDGPGVGVVSAQRRALPRESGVMGIKFQVRPGEDLGAEGVSIESIFPDSGAEAAGLTPGDVIVKINDRPTPRQDDLLQAVKQYPPGETIRVTFRRDDQQQEVQVTLGEPAAVFKEFFADRNLAISGEVSRRRTGFSAVIQHHIPMLPSQCGGPLVDLEGRIVGVNIARASRTDSYALPAEIVREAMDRLIASQTSQQVSTEAPPVPTDQR